MPKPKSAPKSKGHFQRLAPIYIVLVLALFVGLLLSNLVNLQNQRPLDIFPWLVNGLIVSAIIIVIDGCYQLECEGQTDPKALDSLHFVRILLGLLLLIPSLLTMAGLDMADAINRYYIAHGYGTEGYRSIWLPAPDNLVVLVLPLTLLLAVYLLLLGKARLLSPQGAVRAILAFIIWIPLVVLVISANWATGWSNSF